MSSENPLFRRPVFWLLMVILIGALAGCVAPSGSNSPMEATEVSKTMNPPSTPVTAPPGREIATLAGGCFWCTEAIFRDLKGVDKVESGYSGGGVPNPSYEQVCSGTTGHAEAIQITYDPKTISFKQILEVFLTTHDPTTLNRQGADAGTQYRSAIFTHGDEQKKEAEAAIKEIGDKHIWSNPIVTEITPFSNFYKAEDYHQDYYANNGRQGYCQIVIAPKVAKFRDHYRELLKR